MIDWFRYITGQSFEEFTALPTLEQTVALYLKQSASGELLSLGHSLVQGEVAISQAEREGQMHIIGAPGQGKSKFLEYLICRDIDRLIADQDKPKDERTGCGLCFIDPSAKGNTAKKVLAYCASKGFKKVFWIDAGSLYQFGKVASLNPFDCSPTYFGKLIADLTEAFRVAFGATEPGRQAYIEMYLPAIFSAIYHATGTLSDTQCFLSAPNANPLNEQRRQAIFDLAFQNGTGLTKNHIQELEYAYRNTPNFRQEIGSTVRRLASLYRGEEALNYIFGHRDGTDFERLITEGWVILVNASDEHLDTMPARLLSAIIINRIISTKEKLYAHKYTKPYYVYVDEVSQFATRTLADLLDLKRQIGMRVILSHQYPDQIEDKRVKKSVENNTLIKVAFYISDPAQRKETMRVLGYEGTAMWEVLSRQEKQQMVVRIGKGEPVVARVPDTPDIEADTDEFLKSIMTNEVAKYYSAHEVRQDYDERYKLSGTDTVSPASRKTPDRQKSGKNPVPKRGADKGVPKSDEAVKDSGKRTPYKF